MAIGSGNIKFYKSGKMTDRDDAGGMATAQELIGGVSNEIMPDLSPLNRAEGAMFMRKIFAHIQTSDVDVYLGAHTIFTKIPKDQKLAAFMFNSKSYHDIRSEASAKFASYRARSARYQGTLWATQWANSKALLLFQSVDAPVPDNNEVYEIVDKTNPNHSQFVRVVNVDHEVRTFTDSNSTFKKRIVTLELSQQLNHSFTGSEIKKEDAISSDVSIYTTSVVDASRIYTSKPLTAPIVAGQPTCTIDTPFVQAVPASAGFKGLLNQQAYDARKAGGRTSVLMSSTGTSYVSFTAGRTFQLTPFDADSFVISGGSTIGILTVQGRVLLHNNIPVGTADPFAGTITLTGTIGTDYVTVKYKQLASIARTGVTFKTDITSANVSTTYTYQFPKFIEKGSVVIQYKSLGETYTLRDTLNGGLEGDGSGTIDYASRSVAINLNSLPDEDSAILWSYATSIAERTIQNVTGFGFGFSIPTTGRGLDTSSIVIGWSDGATVRTITEATSGTDGTFKLVNNELVVTPNVLPAKGTVVTTVFNYATTITTDVPSTDASYDKAANEWTLTSPTGAFVANKFKAIQYHSPRHNLYGWAYLTSPITSDKSIQVTYVDNGNGDIIIEGGATVIGSINYVTGVATITPHYQYRGYGFYSVGQIWNSINESAVCPSDLVGNIKFTTPQTNNTQSENRTDVINDITVVIEALSFEGIVSNAGTSFKLNGKAYMTKDHKIYKLDGILLNPSTPVGEVDPLNSSIKLNDWKSFTSGGISNLFMNFVAATDQVESELSWFTKSAPIQNGSIHGEVRLLDGTLASFISDNAGVITSPNSAITGTVNSQMGITSINTPQLMIAGSMRYNVTIQETIPVDADVIKMDTVRLPVDGRLTAYRRGDLVAVIHDVTTTNSVSNTDVQTLRNQTTYVRIVDATGAFVPVTAYTLDLASHTLTWDDVTGVAMPVTVVDRIENLRVLTKVSNTGELTVRDPFDFAFPATNTLVCSAMVHTDIFASVTKPFDQKTWFNTWSNVASGLLSLGEYNDVVNPIQVTNQGAIDERWLILFKSATTVDVISEHLGLLIADADIGSIISPINPIQGVPYWTIPANALNTGFSGGNVVRFNTISADAPIWIMESVSFGTPTDTSTDAHTFCIETRGAVNV